MRIVRLEKEQWAELSEKAHRVVFSENKPSSMERIDFALVAEDDESNLHSYTTCRELDATTLYWQYGGSFPGTKGTVRSLEAFRGFLRYAKEAGYERVCFYVENTNKAMLKLAMKCGFLISGIRNYKHHILVEHILEF